jgi:hypothetical protein
MPSLDKTLRSLLSIGLVGALALGCSSEPPKGPGAEASGKDGAPGEPSNNGPEDGAVEEVEPNNGLKQAQALELKKNIRGTLGPVLKGKGDEDWFAIDTGAQKLRVKASLSAVPEIDLGLTFFDARGERLAVINNRPAGEAEAVPAVGLPPGKSYVRVREVEKKGKEPLSDEVHPYLLVIEDLPDAPDEELEPNDKRVDAGAAQIGQELHGYLAWKGDLDWYKIPTAGVEAGSVMRIDFKGVPGVTPQIQIFDSIEDKIWEVTPVKPEEPMTLRNIAIQTGSGFDAYYVVVGAKKGSNTEERYTLAVSFEKGGGDTELEPNNDRKKATPISNGQHLAGILSQGDVDLYKVVADAPAILRVELDGVEGVNLQIEVQNSSGQKILAVNEGAKKEGEVVPDLSIPLGETFLKISGGKGEFNDTAPYVVGVSLAPQDGTMEVEPNNERERATEIAPGNILVGYFFPKGDIDMYRLDLTGRGGPVALSITATGIPKADLDISVVNDATSAVVDSAAKKPAGEDETLRVTLDPGLYQIVIKGKSSNPRDTYQLRVEER